MIGIIKYKLFLNQIFPTLYVKLTMIKKKTPSSFINPLKKIFLMLLFTLLIALPVVGLGAYLYLQQPQFTEPESVSQINSAPLTARLQDGIFHNQNDVAMNTSDQSSTQSIMKFLFQEDENSIPAAELPSVKTDLKQLDRDQEIVLWMGHSSYFIQIDGLRILVDPVFSDYASPVPNTNTAFSGSNIYNAEDIPEIDFLLITHDHWDHLDYSSIDALRDKIDKVVTPLGVGSYFTQWGFAEDKIFEGDWNSQFVFDNLTIHILPAQHFSGRLLDRNRTLWGSFALITAKKRIYLGGDSGYNSHYKEIGQQFGSFDLAILECGQYDPAWSNIHMMPEQTAQAAVDLNAAALLPSHNSKFKIAHHTWDDPLKRIAKASENKPYRLLTPKIGQLVEMNNPTQVFTQWWTRALN